MSVVFQIGCCLAGLDVAAMACMLRQGVGWVLIGKTGCVRFVTNQDVEDEQHFLFHCPAYSDIRRKYATMFQQAFTAPDLITKSEPNVLGGFLRESFSCREALLSI